MNDDETLGGEGAAAAINTIEDLTKRAIEVRSIELPTGSLPVAVLPKGTMQMLLEDHLPEPLRPTIAPTFNRVEAWIEYCQRFDRDDVTVSFLDAGTDSSELRRLVRLISLIDYHQPNGADCPIYTWTNHRPRMTVPYSLEWQIWTDQAGSPMAQVEFARFLEENAPDITVPENDPDAPDQGLMMDVSLNLEAKRNVTFRASTRLDSGDQSLDYTTETTAGTKEGRIKLPRSFWVSLPVFADGPKYSIKAWFRYRMRDGELKLWFDLHRPHIARDLAIDALHDQLVKELNSPVYLGEP